MRRTPTPPNWPQRKLEVVARPVGPGWGWLAGIHGQNTDNSPTEDDRISLCLSVPDHQQGPFTKTWRGPRFPSGLDRHRLPRPAGSRVGRRPISSDTRFFASELLAQLDLTPGVALPQEVSRGSVGSRLRVPQGHPATETPSTKATMTRDPEHHHEQHHPETPRPPHPPHGSPAPTAAPAPMQPWGGRRCRSARHISRGQCFQGGRLSRDIPIRRNRFSRHPAPPESDAGYGF